MAFVLVAISMIAVVSAAAIAIDIGLLVTARTESQRAAEAAALAGAGWLLQTPTDEAGARARAKEYGLLNTVRGQGAVLLDEDIDVILDSSKVRVRVNNVRDRGTAIKTFFARAFGVRDVNVRTLAAAWAAPVTGFDEARADTKCLLPIALQDQWNDTNDNGQYDVGESYSTEGTSFGSYSVGDLIAVKVSGSQDKGPPACKDENESGEVDLDLCREVPLSENWRCWWKDEPSGGGGAEELGARIFPGTECNSSLGIDSPVYVADAGGNKQSLINTIHEELGGSCEEKCYDYDENPDTGVNGAEFCETQCPNGAFGDLIRADSLLLGISLKWCESCKYSPDQLDPPGCPVVQWSAPGGPPVSSTTCYTGESYRMREVPLVRPDEVTGTGAGINTSIAEFTGVFVDKVACNYDQPMFQKSNGNLNVYIRIMNTNVPGGTTGGGEPGPGPEGTTVKKLQLIE